MNIYEFVKKHVKPILSREDAKSQHTRGPWYPDIAYSFNGVIDGLAVMAESGESIADVHVQHMTDEDAKANARLMSAAPDLYEVCDKIFESGGGGRHRAALVEALRIAERR